MRINIERTAEYLSRCFTMNPTIEHMAGNLLEYVENYYDGGKPYDILLKVLAPIGFTEETLESLIAKEYITFE